MPTVEKTYYKVNLRGEVIIDAENVDDAIRKAGRYFMTTGQGLAWEVNEVKVQIIPPPEVGPPEAPVEPAPAPVEPVPVPVEPVPAP